MSETAEPRDDRADDDRASAFFHELEDDRELSSKLADAKERWEAGELEKERIPEEVILRARERNRQRPAS